MEGITAILVTMAVLAILFSSLKLRRAKQQIAEMSEALADIKNGNGNRRILAAEEEIAAPIAYEINEIVQSYEKKLFAFREAEETNKQLMTSLSHDVRTPLTTLIGYLDAVHKDMAAGKEGGKEIETARQKAHDLKEYIDVLFDWFKLGSGEFTMQSLPVEITELTRNILIGWIPILEEKQIAYQVEIPEQPIFVTLDTDGYTRIWNNLIQNVLNHSQADQIKVEISCRNGEVRMRLSDNGTGISQEDLKHIFERLCKCDKSRSGKGSGLGLSIARQLAEKMGGRIEAESRLGTGTVFTLFFPLAEAKCR